MKINILEKTTKDLKIEIHGEGHTLCNVLQKTLLEDDNVEIGGYDIPHPLIPKSIVYVRTKGKRRPKTALKDAARKIVKRNKSIRKELKKALKQWKKKKRLNPGES